MSKDNGPTQNYINSRNKIIEYESVMLTNQGIKHSIVEDEFGLYYIKKHSPSDTIDTTIDSDTIDYDDIWLGVGICNHYEFPMPTYCLSDKNYKAKEYAALMVLSNKDVKVSKIPQNRYLYQNKFDINDLAKELGVHRTTISRNISKLVKSESLLIHNTKNGIVHIFAYGEVNYSTLNINKFVTIHQPMLKVLACCFSSNAIKLYSLFRYMTTESNFKAMDNKWLSEQIGLSPKSHNNLDTITQEVSSLELNGFIETKKSTEFIWDDKKLKQVPTIRKMYRLRTFDEWMTIQSKDSI